MCVCVHEEDGCLSVCVDVWLLGVGDGELRDRGVGLDEEKSWRPQRGAWWESTQQPAVLALIVSGGVLSKQLRIFRNYLNILFLCPEQ